MRALAGARYVAVITLTAIAAAFVAPDPCLSQIARAPTAAASGEKDKVATM